LACVVNFFFNSAGSLLGEQLGIGREYHVYRVGAVSGVVNQLLPAVNELGHFAGLAALGG
jgi:hypothetical protein